MSVVTAPGPADVEAATRVVRERLARTPLLRVPKTGFALKLECLQPSGSFKIRGAWNALADSSDRSTVRTASAGNMGRSAAWAGRELGRPVVASVPEGAAANKLEAMRAMGATVETVSYDDWWHILDTHGAQFGDATFVHPFADVQVMAGNSTISVELVEQMPEVGTMAVGLGGGGLACGIAAGIAAQAHPAELVIVEVDRTAPLTAALAAGEPVTIDAARTFVDGAGSPRVREEMWPLLKEAVSRTVTVTLDEVRSAVRFLAEECHVIAEGAGALGVAAALAGKLDGAPVACVVSGGNIDMPVLADIVGVGRVGAIA